jgi:hypothetical protein
VLPRVSVDVGYARRTFQNFMVTDNLAVGPDDFDQFSIVAPADSRLPNGGGYTLSNLYDVRPALSGVTDDFQTFSKAYGRETRHWNGVEVNFTARVRNGLTFQGGTSTGRLTTDTCELREVLPEIGLLDPYCKETPPFTTQFKGLGSYVIPVVDVQVSGTLQSLVGDQLSANYSFPSAVVAASLGRPLSGNAQFATINLIEPGDVYGDRINQLDFRVSKLFRFGGTRAQIAIDLYNALNANSVQSYNQTFIAGSGSWPRPTSILEARFIKLTTQFDF